MAEHFRPQHVPWWPVLSSYNGLQRPSHGMRSQSEGKWMFSLWQMKRIRMAPSVEKMRPAG
jgi:hypothetical protein